MAVAAHVSMSDDTETGKLRRTCLQDGTTKLFRDLCDAHIQSTELERTLVCRFGVGVSHVLQTWHLADPNILTGGLCLQPQKSHVQMTEALQTFFACFFFF